MLAPAKMLQKGAFLISRVVTIMHMNLPIAAVPEPIAGHALVQNAHLMAQKSHSPQKAGVGPWSENTRQSGAGSVHSSAFDPTR